MVDVVKPLDLDGGELIKKFSYDEDLNLAPLAENIGLAFNNTMRELIYEIKQRIRSACMFYLKYKDKPELLVKERPDKAMIEIDYDTAEDIVKEIHRIVERYGKVEAQATIRLKIIEYNEWLFKLSFKDVLENEI